MTERTQLEQAVMAIEAQRAILGDAAVDTALKSLRQQLAALQQADSSHQSVAASSSERRRLPTPCPGKPSVCPGTDRILGWPNAPGWDTPLPA
jgi:hypothetical protein